MLFSFLPLYLRFAFFLILQDNVTQDCVDLINLRFCHRKLTILGANAILKATGYFLGHEENKIKYLIHVSLFITRLKSLAGDPTGK